LQKPGSKSPEMNIRKYWFVMQMRGYFFFDFETKEEVEQLLANDPAIAAGRPAYEIHPFYTRPNENFKPGEPERKQ
jgi:hypothetical protein